MGERGKRFAAPGVDAIPQVPKRRKDCSQGNAGAGVRGKCEPGQENLGGVGAVARRCLLQLRL
jgi:hypothetical protein